MHTKSILKNGTAAFCMALSFAACGEEDLTQHGVAPSSIADITLDADMNDIRPEQPITASIVLPTGGENISTTAYTWDMYNYPSDNVADGKAYYTFLAPDKSGNYTLEFHARYTFIGPDVNGNIYKDLTSTLDYTVTTCDIFSSKWGDNAAKTLEVHPSLMQNPSDNNIYFAQFDDRLSMIQSPKPQISRYYQFGAEGLEKITEMEIFSNTKPDAYMSKFALLCDRARRELGMTCEESYYVAEDNLNGPHTEFDVSLPVGEWDAAIGEKMQSGAIRVFARLQNGRTEMLISAFSTGNGNGEIYLVRDYTPAQ